MVTTGLTTLSIAIDTTSSVLGLGKQLDTNGIEGVIKYTQNTQQFPNKAFTVAEITELHSCGLKVGHVYEAGNTVDSFGQSQGRAAGILSVQHLTNLQAPKGTVIYRSVDYDATSDDLHRPIYLDFVAFASVVRASGFRPGAYGSRKTLAFLTAAKLIDFRWLAESKGWTDSLYYDDWDIKQQRETTLLGLDVDMNIIRGSGGLY